MKNLLVKAPSLLRWVLSFCLSASFVGATCTPVSRFEPLPLCPDDNTLGIGDVFAVRVFNEAELTQDYRVGTDGTIDYPYLGRVRVQGQLPASVADTIRNGLQQRGILREPQVSVFVREVTSRRVDLIGAVARSGSVPFTPGMTIIQAIAGAGGFTPLANRDRVTLIRSCNGRRRTTVVPVQSIIEGRATNILLTPNDVINVPESAM